MLSIDYEDEANDENKKQNENLANKSLTGQTATNPNNSLLTTPTAVAPTVCVLKQRLLEGVEKISNSKLNSTENVPTTPRSAAKSSNRARKLAHNSVTKKISMKKRKRKNFINDSTEESDFKNSDSGEDL
jgi:hypothetical protein